MKTMARTKTGLVADAITHVAITLATAKVSISSSAISPCTEIALPEPIPSPRSFQTEGRTAEVQTTWRSATITEAHPSVTQERTIPRKLSAAIAEGLLAIADPRRVPTRPTLVAGCRIPSATTTLRVRSGGRRPSLTLAARTSDPCPSPI